MRTDDAITKYGKSDALNLFQVSPCSIRDQAGRAKSIEGITEHIAKSRRRTMGIEILQDDDGQVPSVRRSG